MKLTMRAALLALTIPAAVVTGYAAQGSARNLGIDWHLRTDDQGDGEPLTRQREANKVRLDNAKRRAEMKQLLADDVVTGRRPLAHTAALFVDLNRLPDDLTETIRYHYGMDSDLECAACQIMDYAHDGMVDESAPSCGEVVRLTGELIALFAADRVGAGEAVEDTDPGPE